MAKSRKIKIPAPAITPGATEVEIELPPEWMHLEDIAETHTPKDQFQAELTRRVQSITKDLVKPEDLLGNEEFLKRVAAEKKDDMIKLIGILPPKGGDVDVAKIQAEVTERVRRDEVKPLFDQTKGLEAEVSLLRRRDLQATILEANKDLQVVPDLSDLVVMYVAERVVWDPTSKSWFVKKMDGTEGYEFSSDPQRGGHPYKGPRELLEDIKKKGDHKSWFTSGVQPGADFQKGPAGTPGSMSLEQYDALPSEQKTAFAQEHEQEFTRLMDLKRAAGEQKLASAGAMVPAGAK